MSVSVRSVQAKNKEQRKKGEEDKCNIEEGKCWNSNGDSFGVQKPKGLGEVWEQAGPGCIWAPHKQFLRWLVHANLPF